MEISRVSCGNLARIYLRRATPSDARNAVDLHQKVHKIWGMMGLLDVMKVHRKNLTAWKGQFQCQEKFADLGSEAVTDDNL